MSSFPSIADATILVVEDEYMIADDLSRDLTRHGVSVMGPFATLEQAFAAVAAERPDLAVDVDLRGDSAFPLADLLTAQEIPFVFVTGYDAGMVPERFDAIARLEKPVRIQELLRLLDRPSSNGEAPSLHIAPSAGEPTQG